MGAPETVFSGSASLSGIGFSCFQALIARRLNVSVIIIRLLLFFLFFPIFPLHSPFKFAIVTQGARAL